jgi:hypothetical protein
MKFWQTASKALANNLFALCTSRRCFHSVPLPEILCRDAAGSFPDIYHSLAEYADAGNGWVGQLFLSFRLSAIAPALRPTPAGVVVTVGVDHAGLKWIPEIVGTR